MARSCDLHGRPEHGAIAGCFFQWLELHTDHEPGGRSVKRLIRKGRKERKGNAARTFICGCRFHRYAAPRVSARWASTRATTAHCDRSAEWNEKAEPKRRDARAVWQRAAEPAPKDWRRRPGSSSRMRN